MSCGAPDYGRRPARRSTAVECPGLLRLLSLLARVAFAVTLGLVLLAVSRFAPVAAEPPLDVRALRLALPLVLFAVTAALTGGLAAVVALRALAVALALVLAALAAVVIGRGPGGLPAEVGSAAASVGHTEPGAIEFTGRELSPFALGRRTQLRWSGELRVPASGRYELWVEGRGSVSVTLGGGRPSKPRAIRSAPRSRSGC